MLLEKQFSKKISHSRVFWNSVTTLTPCPTSPFSVGREHPPPLPTAFISHRWFVSDCASIKTENVPTSEPNLVLSTVIVRPATLLGGATS